MTDLMALLIAATPPTIVAGGALVLAIVNKRTLKEFHAENKADLSNIHLEINGRLQQLLDVTKKSSHAEGVLEQKNSEAKDQ